MENLNEYKYIRKGYTLALQHIHCNLTSSSCDILKSKKNILKLIELMIRYRDKLIETSDVYYYVVDDKKKLLDLRFDV